MQVPGERAERAGLTAGAPPTRVQPGGHSDLLSVSLWRVRALLARVVQPALLRNEGS